MGPIVRGRFKAEAAASTAEVATPQVSSEARLLALAYVIEQAVEDGRYRAVADVARALGLSRARLSQVMRRRWGPVRDQEMMLGALAGAEEL